MFSTAGAPGKFRFGRQPVRMSDLPIIARQRIEVLPHLEHHAAGRAAFASASSGVWRRPFPILNFSSRDGRYQDCERYDSSREVKALFVLVEERSLIYGPDTESLK